MAPSPPLIGTWTTHGLVVAVLLLGAIPVHFADQAWLGPSHGGYISLDFRGLGLLLYAVLCGLFVLISTGVVAFSVYRGWTLRMPWLYAISTGLLVAALVTAYGVADYRRSQELERSLEIWRLSQARVATQVDLVNVSWPQPSKVSLTVTVTSPVVIDHASVHTPDGHFGAWYEDKELTPGTHTLEVDLQDKSIPIGWRVELDVKAGEDATRLWWFEYAKETEEEAAKHPAERPLPKPLPRQP